MALHCKSSWLEITKVFTSKMKEKGNSVDGAWVAHGIQWVGTTGLDSNQGRWGTVMGGSCWGHSFGSWGHFFAVIPSSVGTHHAAALCPPQTLAVLPISGPSRSPHCHEKSLTDPTLLLKMHGNMVWEHPTGCAHSHGRSLASWWRRGTACLYLTSPNRKGTLFPTGSGIHPTRIAV